MDVQPPFDALWALLQTAYGWKTKELNLRSWSDVDRMEQPYISMVQGNPRVQTNTNGRSVWTLQARVYIYAHCQTQDGDSPAAASNVLLKAVSETLKPLPAQEKQSLGGLVHYARIEGEIETDEGFLGEQVVLIIPIEMMAVDY